ncbi:MAG: hypothetical protein RLZZ44_215 [Bacteroidota bacterium]
MGKNKKPKIIFCIGDANIGGAEKQLVRLAQEIDKTKTFEVIIWFLNSGGPLIKQVEESEIKYKIFDLRILKPWKLVNLIFEFRTTNPDIINTYLVKNIFIISIIKPFVNSKAIFFGSIRGVNFKKGLIYKLIFRKALNSCNKIICNSNFLKCFIGSKYEKKSIVIKNGIDFNSVDRSLVSPNNIVMISNFHPYKGFDFLVEILSHISVECNLTIYGEVTDFIKYFNPKQINKKVKINFRGQVNKLNNSDLANYSFAIHTSRSEGLSNAIIEELSAGLPVIAFDTGGNSELIINEINGFLIPAFDLTNFGKKIDYLLKEANSVSNLSKNSKTSIMEMSWNTIVDKHLSVYKH